MEEIKPLKRSKELAPLSREHHDGLLFAWKIKQGLVNGTSVETLCKYTHWFWTNHLEAHFKDEETVLVKFLSADNPLIFQMFKEHAQIRALISSLDKEPGSGSLQSLADLVNKHIRFEERELFVYAEKKLTQEQLEAIYKELPHDLHCDNEWEDEFWVRK